MLLLQTMGNTLSAHSATAAVVAVVGCGTGRVWEVFKTAGGQQVKYRPCGFSCGGSADCCATTALAALLLLPQ
jgi:hypothetical protein